MGKSRHKEEITEGHQGNKDQKGMQLECSFLIFYFKLGQSFALNHTIHPYSHGTSSLRKDLEKFIKLS